MTPGLFSSRQARTLLLVLLTGLAAPATAQRIDEAAEYGACMAEARRDPQSAFDRAVGWRGLGGGEAADHCAATALIGIGQYGEAARRLESLAQTTRRPPAFRAQVLSQAAQAWMLDGNAGQAEVLLSVAVAIEPDNADIRIDRSFAYAALGRYEEAIGDLDRALVLAPNRADAYAYRASARRLTDDLGGATSDAERALSLDPNSPEGLLERGIIRRLKGDNAGARADWMKIIALTPDSDAARAAQANVEKMDLKTD
jgi:tetratricopeptide (TPR) repeat protein